MVRGSYVSDRDHFTLRLRCRHPSLPAGEECTQPASSPVDVEGHRTPINLIHLAGDVYPC